MEEPVGLFFPIWRLQIRLVIDHDYDDIDGDGDLDVDDLDSDGDDNVVDDDLDGDGVLDDAQLFEWLFCVYMETVDQVNHFDYAYDYAIDDLDGDLDDHDLES